MLVRTCCQTRGPAGSPMRPQSCVRRQVLGGAPAPPSAEPPDAETLALILESMRDAGSEDDEDSDAEQAQAWAGRYQLPSALAPKVMMTGNLLVVVPGWQLAPRRRLGSGSTAFG